MTDRRKALKALDILREPARHGSGRNRLDVEYALLSLEDYITWTVPDALREVMDIVDRMEHTAAQREGLTRGPQERLSKQERYWANQIRRALAQQRDDSGEDDD